jgi:small-conductance mechanosensitive channel
MGNGHQGSPGTWESPSPPSLGGPALYPVQFITGNLTNWTHKDKIVRVVIKVNVALGTDADQVSDLLLSNAQTDPDVLNNPVPSALLEAFGEASLAFVLHVFVPEPSLMGRVRHRLYGEIQERFEACGIVGAKRDQEPKAISAPDPFSVA